MLLARGLSALSWQVEFWLFSEQPWVLLDVKRSYGIRFISLCRRFPYLGRFGRLFSRIISILESSFLLLQLSCGLKFARNAEHCKDKVVLAIMSTDMFVITPISLLARILRIKTFHERTEFPHLMIENTRRGHLGLRIYMRYLLPAFGVVAAINDALISHIRVRNPRVLKLLTVVDTDYFCPSTAQTEPYIAYCGTMYGTKDGLDILLEAFLRISREFLNIRLLLIGDNSKKEKLKHLFDFISANDLHSRVIFTGRVQRDQLPRLLSEASVLALAKPDNEQNSGNFPIKLGEYLATGVPVLATSVGEIPRFINDGYNGFLCAPDAEAFSKRLKDILTNPEVAKLVGLRGRDVATQNFDFRSQAAVMSTALFGLFRQIAPLQDSER